MSSKVSAILLSLVLVIQVFFPSIINVYAAENMKPATDKTIGDNQSELNLKDEDIVQVVYANNVLKPMTVKEVKELKEVEDDGLTLKVNGVRFIEVKEDELVEETKPSEVLAFLSYDYEKYYDKNSKCYKICPQVRFFIDVKNLDGEIGGYGTPGGQGSQGDVGEAGKPGSNGFPGPKGGVKLPLFHTAFENFILKESFDWKMTIESESRYNSTEYLKKINEYDLVVYQRLKNGESVRLGVAEGVLTEEEQPKLVYNYKVETEKLQTEPNQPIELYATYEVENQILKELSSGIKADTTIKGAKLDKEDNNFCEVTQCSWKIEADRQAAGISGPAGPPGSPGQPGYENTKFTKYLVGYGELLSDFYEKFYPEGLAVSYAAYPIAQFDIGNIKYKSSEDMKTDNIQLSLVAKLPLPGDIGKEYPFEEFVTDMQGVKGVISSGNLYKDTAYFGTWKIKNATELDENNKVFKSYFVKKDDENTHFTKEDKTTYSVEEYEVGKPKVFEDAKTPVMYKYEWTEELYDRTTAHNYEEVSFINVPNIPYTLNKKWVGTNGKDLASKDIKVDSVEVDVYKDGEYDHTVTLKEEENWKTTVLLPYATTDYTKLKNLTLEELEEKLANKEYTTVHKYTFKEKEVDGYEATVDTDYDLKEVTFTNKKKPEQTAVSVEKVWKLYKEKATPVKVELLADGKVIDEVELNEKNGWKHTFSELEKHKDGTDEVVKYEVKEKGVDTKKFKVSIKEEEPHSFIITNTEKVKMKPLEPAKTKVKVSKEWDGKKQKEVIVELLKDGKREDTAILNAKNQWTHTFKNLPVQETVTSKDKHEYTVREVAPDTFKYDVEIKGNAKEGFVILNKEIERTDIDVAKKWVLNKEKPYPVKVQLLANDKEVMEVELSEVNDWKATFKDLRVKEKDSNKKIKYTVKEITLNEKFNSSVTGNAKDGFTIINEEVQEVCEDFTVNVKEDDKPLKDATVIIKDKDGKEFAKGMTDKNGTFITDKPLTPEQDYTIELSKDGYKKTVKKVKGDKENCEVVYNLQPVEKCESFIVEIVEVPQAKVVIKDNKGEVFAEGTTDKDGIFKAGKPVITGEEYEITVEKEGYETVVEKMTQTDAEKCVHPITLKPVKQPEEVCEDFTVNVKEDDKALEDATVVIKDKDGKEFAKGTTDKNGAFVSDKPLTPEEDYIVEVLKDSYDKVVKTVTGDKENCEVTVPMKKTPIKEEVCENFTVNVKEDDKASEDATVVIEDKDGKEFAKGTTDKNGTFITDKPLTPEQDYTIELSKDGYDKVVKTVTGDKENCEVTVEVTKNTEEPKVCEDFTVVIKDDDNDTYKVEIFDNAGELVTEGETDEEGRFVTEPLEDGKEYRVVVTNTETNESEDVTFTHKEQECTLTFDLKEEQTNTEEPKEDEVIEEPAGEQTVEKPDTPQRPTVTSPQVQQPTVQQPTPAPQTDDSFLLNAPPKNMSLAEKHAGTLGKVLPQMNTKTTVIPLVTGILLIGGAIYYRKRKQR